jgi:RND family efflux transporter MFP subunit
MALSGCGEDDVAPQRTPELVKAEVIARTSVSRTISLTGTVSARVESELSFRTAGRIAERRVDVSDRVKAGDVLATLETEEQAADLQASRATLQAAEATLVQARTNFDRQQQLLSRGFTTQSSFDAAQEQLRSAESSVESARADLGSAEERLSFTVLKADADGIVTARDVEAGQVVSAAQTVFTVARDGARDATFDIYEALLAGDPPDRVEVRLTSDPDVMAFATIREVSPTFDSATGTVRVKMSLIDPPAAMSLGAAVTGVGVTEAQRLFVLPWGALTAGVSGPAVWVVDPASKAVTLRSVTIERYRTGEVLVREGLTDGDLVVIAGGQLLREGQTVAVASGEAS